MRQRYKNADDVYILPEDYLGVLRESLSLLRKRSIKELIFVLRGSEPVACVDMLYKYKESCQSLGINVFIQFIDVSDIV